MGPTGSPAGSARRIILVRSWLRTYGRIASRSDVQRRSGRTLRQCPIIGRYSHQGTAHMIDLLTDPQAWIAFFTLTALELVLGIDNVIFISILVDKLPGRERELARRVGLFLAMLMRIGLLFLLAWIAGLTAPLVSVFRQGLS